MNEIEYTYPLYPWEKDWSQVFIYQWHLVTHGEFAGAGYDFGPADVRKTLEQIKKIANVTRGIPKVIILCDWQEYSEIPSETPTFMPDGSNREVTWDCQFPCFTATSKEFIDTSIGSTPEDAIRWLMEEAKKYDTAVTFHVNFSGAQSHSPLWELYKGEDLLLKDINGGYIDYPGTGFEGKVDLKKEYDKGLFQKRFGEFVDTFPGLLETKLIHCDWNFTEDNRYHGTMADDELLAMRRNMAWIKETYGIDTSCELVATIRPEYDYGMQCMALSFNRPDSKVSVDLMKVPAYIYCGGDSRSGAEHSKYGAVEFDGYHLLFGSSLQGEGGTAYIDENYIPGGKHNNNLFRDFCYGTLTWYYLNRLLRISYDEANQKVCYSDGVTSYIKNDELYITKDGEYIRQGNDIFIPALWKKKNIEIMAWSDSGYTDKTWKLPENWTDCKIVDLYDNHLTGTSFRESVSVENGGYVTLSLGKRDGVIIVPHNADTAGREPEYTPSGTAELICADTVTSSGWSGKYGKDGYYLPETENHSPLADIKMIGGAIGTEVQLHQIVDINSGENSICVSVYLHDRSNNKGQVMLDMIDAYSNERIGKSILLNHYENGIYAIYKVKGHVRFRLTKFHYDHFGRGDGANESGTLSLAGIFIDNADNDNDYIRFAPLPK